MQRLSLFLLLFVFSFLSSGFTNVFQKSKDPEIKGIICGTDLYMNVLIDNFPKEEIFSNKAEDAIYEEFDYIDGEYFYRYIFDIKTGKLYISDDSSNTYVSALKPLYQEKFSDGISYTYKSEKKGNSLKVFVTEYSYGSKVDNWEDDINLKKLTNTFIEDGEEVVQNCIYFPLPGTQKILN